MTGDFLSVQPSINFLRSVIPLFIVAVVWIPEKKPDFQNLIYHISLRTRVEVLTVYFERLDQNLVCFDIWVEFGYV